MRIEVNAEHPEPRKIRHAVEDLRRGGVIAYPTDTVYGLGCDIFEKKALDRLYRIKPMPKDHPVAFVCPDLSDIARYAQVDDRAYRLMKRLLPGPYCFILPATREVPRVLMMKRKQVGIRVPAHPVAQALVRELGHPIVSTSATVDGDVLHDPAEIAAQFKGLDRILDVGAGGFDPSTVIDLTGDDPVVTREGAGPVDFV
jgi:tRNA threonylcarbamoyl adenosine modification protein (Sua5/YciO/YrdC/YwlC family)